MSTFKVCGIYHHTPLGLQGEAFPQHRPPGLPTRNGLAVAEDKGVPASAVGLHPGARDFPMWGFHRQPCPSLTLRGSVSCGFWWDSCTDHRVVLIFIQDGPRPTGTLQPQPGASLLACRGPEGVRSGYQGTTRVPRSFHGLVSAAVSGAAQLQGTLQIWLLILSKSPLTTEQGRTFQWGFPPSPPAGCRRLCQLLAGSFTWLVRSGGGFLHPHSHPGAILPIPLDSQVTPWTQGRGWLRCHTGTARPGLTPSAASDAEGMYPGPGQTAPSASWLSSVCCRQRGFGAEGA